MPRAEIMTMLTDYALGALAGLWSVLLLRAARRERSRSIALWGAGFLGLALASIAAGTYHGFPDELGARRCVSLWSFVSWTMGLASFLMFSGAILALSRGAWRIALLAAALLKLAAFAILAAGQDEYAFVLLDYGSAQLAILLLAAFAWGRERAPAAPWLAAGIVVSGIGAAVQHNGFAPHEHFNHNDLYHVIQMLGLYFLYRGGARFGN